MWQPAAVLYPDAELEVINGIKALLTTHGESGITFGRKIPPTRTTRMVIVTRDGGSAVNLRDRARLRVLVWDATDQKVTDLARKVVALMPLLADGDPIVRVEHLSGPYEIADVAAPERYLLFEVHLRGEAL